MLDLNNMYNEEPTKATKFLWWASGANVDLLKKLPSAKIKYQIIGLIVITTAFFATITSSYALNFVYNNIFISMLFGSFWGFVIFNIDRFLIVSISKSDSFYKQVIMAVPRLLIAAFIAILVTKPFELAIFEIEINSQHQYILEQKKKFDSSLAKQEINSLDLREKQNNLTNEQIGRFLAGTRVPGHGPVAQLLSGEVDTLKTITDTAKIDTDRYRNELVKYNDIMGMIDSLSNDTTTGILSRLALLNSLKSNKTVYYVDLFLSLMFILLEILPILTKLLLPKDSYDKALEKLINSESMAIESDLLELNSNQDTFAKTRRDSENNFVNELYNKLSEVRANKTNEIFSDWENNKSSLFIDLLKSLSQQFGQSKIEDLGKIEVKPPLFKFRYPTVKRSIKYPAFSGLISGFAWLIIIYAKNSSISFHDFKFALLITIAVSLLGWLLYNLEQKVREQVNEKIKSTAIESVAGAAVFFVGYIVLSVIAKLSFDVEIQDTQQFIEVAVSGGIGKAVTDRAFA